MTLAGYSPAEQVAAIALARVRGAQARVSAWRPYPHQVPPEGDWDVWALIAGRGAGKTEAGARYVDAHAHGPACLDGPVPHRIAVVAPSHDDAVDTCVRGDSGLVRIDPAIRFHPGAAKQADLTWPNGAEAELFGAFAPEDVERFRGPQHCLVWADEFAAWRKLDDAWDMIQFGLRLGPHPRAVVTSTPKRRPLVKAIMADPATAVTHATTDDNPALPEERRRKLYARYGGTVLGRQELLAEIIDDVPGALWQRASITYRMYPRIERAGIAEPDLSRCVVAVDPAVTFTEDADETGIIVDAIGSDGMGYTLADESGRYPPTVWAQKAVAAYHRWKADSIVAEANQGGELVRTVISTVDANVPVRLVHASRGKVTRAEPVASLYIDNPNRTLRWYHVSPFPELEDQMCSYTGEAGSDSPDRMDAHVWGATELVIASSWGGADDVAVA
jgi:phage terminase large subunit-like protein